MPPPPTPDGEDTPKKGMSTGMIVGLVVGLVVLCAGVPAVGGLVYFAMGDSTEDADQVDVEEPKLDAKPKAPPKDTGDAKSADEEKPKEPEQTESKPKPKPKKPTPSTSSRRSSSSSSRSSSSSSRSSSSGRGSSSSSRRSSSSSGSSSSSSSGSTAPSAASFPANVRFVHNGVTTTLQCGDGQQKEFVGSTTMTFNTITTCRVEAEGKRGVVSIKKGGTSTCSISGDRVRCSQP